MTLLDLAQEAIRYALRRAGAESRPAQLLGRRAHYYLVPGRDAGAPPAVLVHGLGGQSNSFARVMLKLRPGFSRIYALDLPGHGFAALEDGEEPFGEMEHFGALREFLVKHVGEPAVLIGNSFGGALALSLAAMSPEWVRGLALVSPAGAPMTEQELGELRSRFRPGARHAVALVKRMYHRAPPGLFLLGPALARHFTGAAVLHVFARSSTDVYIPGEALASLRVPVLLIWGASERLLPPGGLDHFRRHLPPHARIVVMERAGHVAMVERPRATARLILELAAEARRTG